MNLLSSFVCYIDVEVEVDLVGRWQLTGFYGESNRSSKSNSWQLLQTLAAHSDSPCDFNDILSISEEQGGNQ